MGDSSYDAGKDPFSDFFVETKRLDQMDSETFASNLPPPPSPPIGEEIVLDMRKGIEGATLDPIDLPSETSPVVSKVVEIAASERDARFSPHSDEAMGLPLLRACIKEEGEEEFTEKIGRIYWRKEGEHDPECDPCDLSNTGSGKCCIIEVPEGFWESRYTALICMEAPEVRFEDFNDLTLTGRYTCTELDPRYVAVCEPGTIMVRSVQGAKPGSYGATVSKKGILEIDAGFFWRLKSRKVKVSLTGIRKGFGENPSRDPFSAVRFPRRTKEQFDKNEEFLQQAIDLEGGN